MLEAIFTDLVFTISLKRSTQNLQLSTSWPADYPIFAAPTPEAVNAFHTAALKSGGRDNGPPGLRADYGPGYFAAFVIDPDGYRIEAHCQS